MEPKAPSGIGVVQSVYPEMRSGFISTGRENGGAIFFSFGNIIGPNVTRGDRVRFQMRGDHAVNVQLIPK